MSATPLGEDLQHWTVLIVALAAGALAAVVVAGGLRARRARRSREKGTAVPPARPDGDAGAHREDDLPSLEGRLRAYGRREARSRATRAAPGGEEVPGAPRPVDAEVEPLQAAIVEAASRRRELEPAPPPGSAPGPRSTLARVDSAPAAAPAETRPAPVPGRDAGPAGEAGGGVSGAGRRDLEPSRRGELGHVLLPTLALGAVAWLVLRRR